MAENFVEVPQKAMGISLIILSLVVCMAWPKIVGSMLYVFVLSHFLLEFAKPHPTMSWQKAVVTA